jgi:chaperonin GroES
LERRPFTPLQRITKSPRLGVWDCEPHLKLTLYENFFGEFDMPKIKIRPLDDRVVVEPLEAEETTAGGIVLPDNAKEKPQRGTVLAVGPGKLLDDGSRGKLSVEVGDEVIFGKYGGTEIEVDGEDVKILRESDILAKVI